MAKLIKKQRESLDSANNGKKNSVNLNDSRNIDKKNCSCWNLL